MDTINDVVSDDFGNLWLTSDRGILRVPKVELSAVAAGRTNRFNCVAYTEADGLFSAECNGQKSQTAALKTRDGRLWFSTTKGVAIFDPRKLAELESRPPVLVERVAADGEEIIPLRSSRGDEAHSLPGQTTAPNSGKDQSLLTSAATKLAPGRGRVLEIRYTAPTFKAPERVRFRHRLVGFDRDWMEAETRREVRYTNLKPGAYRFEVLASNNHALWSEAPAPFAFTLVPHLWQRHAGVLRRHRDAPAPRPPSPSRAAGQAGATVQRALRKLDEIVWTTDPAHDRLPDLASYLTQHFAERRAAAGVELRIEIADDLPDRSLPASLRQNVFLAASEALTNVIRHAQARTLTLRLTVAGDRLNVEVQDDGRGFAAADRTRAGEPLRRGHGWRYLQERMLGVGGEAQVESAPGQGTRVRLWAAL